MKLYYVYAYLLKVIGTHIKGQIFYLKQSKVYFGYGNMGKLKFYLNQMNWLQIYTFIKWYSLDQFKGYLNDWIVKSEISQFMQHDEL